jgi:subtilisin family serine protease
VVLERDLSPGAVNAFAKSIEEIHGGTVRRVMTAAANIISIEMTEINAVRLSKHPFVISVEENARVFLSSSTTASVPRDAEPGLQSSSTCMTGAGVYVYVVDTGVAKDHAEFQTVTGSKVLNGVAFASDYQPHPDTPNADVGTNPCGGFTNDPDDTPRTYNAGHGTSVASVIAGNTVGVAQDASTVPIRVANCPTYADPQDACDMNPCSNTEHLSWGLDWIRGLSNPWRVHRPALVNISMWKDAGDALVGALEHVINGLVLDDYDTASGRPEWSGIPVITSANNHDSLAALTSPARMAWTNTGYQTPGRVVSVGGAVGNSRWDCHHQHLHSVSSCATPLQQCAGVAGSNYGDAVDVYANAYAESATIESSSGYRSRHRHGTSFSAALISGTAARLLQANPTYKPADLWTWLQSNAVVSSNPCDPHDDGLQPHEREVGDILLAPTYGCN